MTLYQEVYVDVLHEGSSVCERVWAAVVLRSYKSYFLLILVPYLLLILLFHTQLQTPDAPQTPDVPDPQQAFMQRRQTYLKLHAEELSNSSRAAFRSRRRQLAQRTGSALDDGHENMRPDELSRFSRDMMTQLRDNDLLLDNASHILQEMPSRRVATPTVFHAGQPAYCPGAVNSHTVTFQKAKDIFLYTAYYDDRAAPAAIRVVAVLRMTDKQPLFCHVPTTPGAQRYESVVASYYEMCENHGKDYGGWLLTCEVPAAVRQPPCHVTLSHHATHKPSHANTYTIPVLLLQNPAANKEQFGICVPPLFGYIPSTTLIEFVELSKILGANHLIFYAHHIPREIQKVLHYYESVGMTTVIPWELPVKDRAVWYHGQLLAINDCLYRSMHRFQYLAFNDIDEFIVPHMHQNWSAMIGHLQSLPNASRHSGYSFQSAFFDPLIETSSRVLYDLESDLRTKSFSKVRTKVLVNAARIYELGIHHISRAINDTHLPYYVQPDVAFLHHYRKCMTDFDPRMNCQVFARDESVSRYIPNLRHNVHKTLWILKETEKLSYRDRYARRR